ncbi:hypothetical protein Tco_0092947 [Tanacetum coccineum]
MVRENDKDKVNIASFVSEPTVNYFDDFDYFKDLRRKSLPAIAYNDALTSKLDFSKPTVSPQHIDEFDETSLSESPPSFIYFCSINSVRYIVPAVLSVLVLRSMWMTFFGTLTNQTWCDEFEVLMKGDLSMSVLGELTFFLGSYKSINYYKATACIGFFSAKHKSRIGSSLCTLPASRLILCLQRLKYLKGQPKLGLWYPIDSPFVLEAYNDSDYAGSNGDRKSTTGRCQFLGRRLISWQCKSKT